MPNFQLVNPYIEGDFKTIFSGKTSYDAAQKAWDGLSEHLTNNVPKFGFTLERMNDKKLIHFVVKENIKDGLVDYKLIEHQVEMNDEEIKHLRDKINSFRHQTGGRKHKKDKKDKDSESNDDSGSDSDSSEVFSKVKYNKYMHQSQPILYMWYNPLIYRFDTLFVPTFVVPLTPYIEIELSSAFF